jgi:hypothetical protein
MPYWNVEGFGKHRTPILLEDSYRTNHVINEVVNIDSCWNLQVAMQDDLGVRFRKPETDRGFVLPEPPKAENIRVILGCHFQILYLNHHAVYLSQHGLLQARSPFDGLVAGGYLLHGPTVAVRIAEEDEPDVV